MWRRCSRTEREEHSLSLHIASVHGSKFFLAAVSHFDELPSEPECRDLVWVGTFGLGGRFQNGSELFPYIDEAKKYGVKTVTV